MAQSTMQTWQPPENLNFSRGSEEWPKWIRRFDRYRILSGLKNTTEEEQVNALIYCMGDQADDIFLSFTNLTKEQKGKYNEVKKAFENHFIVKRNIIYERAMFNMRIQREIEPVDEFITSLYTLAEHCEYGNLTSDLIRDRLVVGIRDRKLSERLQLTPDLTLEKATNMLKQSELVKKQNPKIHNDEASLEIDRIMTRKQKNQDFFRQKCNNSNFPRSNKYESKKDDNVCGKCGLSPHEAKYCPANKATCHSCNRTGHWSKMCRNKNMRSSVA